MKKILIIDDSMFQRKLLSDALAEMEYNVIQANTGSAGVEKYKEEGADCVITDLLMPDMSGQEVIKAVKGVDQDQPMLVISADIQKSVREECLSLGINGFLNKPFNKAELKEVLGKIFE